MTWVELTGPVGAGKSALMPSVIESLRSSGREAFPLGGPGALALEAPRRGRRLRAGSAYGLAHPGLAAGAARALLVAPLPWWHRRAIGTLVFRLAATTQAIDHGSDDACLVVDEGWVHRAVNLFGWTPELDMATVDAYLERIRQPDLLIVIEAAERVRAERLAHRGLPKRLRGKDPAVVEDFLQRSARIVEHATSHFEEQGVSVVRIDNSTSLQASTGSVQAQLPVAIGELPAVSASTPMVSVRPPFPLPRPSLAGLGPSGWRRHHHGSDDDFVADALAEYGLQDQPTRPLDQSGRSQSVLVRTPRGAAVLKRYKPTLSASSIRCQHSILLELERLAFPCPRLLRTRDGSTLVERAGRRYDLTVYMPGYARWDHSLLPPRESRQLRQAAGAAVATFHEVLREFEPAFQHDARVAPAHPDDPDALVAMVESNLALDFPADAPAGSQELWEHGEELGASLVGLREKLVEARLPQTVIHGDYGPYNLLFREGRRLAVMDLELARRDWRLIDLARAIPRFGSNRRGFSMQRARRFLLGYLRRQPVPRTELELLPTLSTYLDLRRSVVSWQRYADTGDAQWLRTAAEHLRNSDRARSDSHALALITQMQTQEER